MRAERPLDEKPVGIEGRDDDDVVSADHRSAYDRRGYTLGRDGL